MLVEAVRLVVMPVDTLKTDEKIVDKVEEF
jgi:hypothetical protein